MKYKNTYAVKLMCKVLKIIESGYYRWLKNRDKPSKRKLLPVKIKEILSEHPNNANYGYDRIHKALEICGIKVSRNTVYRAMKEGNLIHKARKPHGTTKATTEIQDKENLIKRNFTANKPVKKLLTVNHSQVSRHKKAQFFWGSGYFVCSQYKASASLGVSILSVPCGLFVL